MYLRSDDRRPQMRNGLALRIGVVGGVAVALFAVLFFRLWYLQVLSGQQVPGRGEQQPDPRVPGQSPTRLHPRPPRQGAGRQPHQPGTAGQPAEAAPPARPRGGRSWRASAGWPTCPPRQVRATMREQAALAAGAPVTLRRDVGYDLVYYLQENQGRFPGVQVQRVFVRRYPHGTLAAHVLGTVGEISEGAAEGSRATAACSRAMRSARAGSSTPMTATCAAGRA